jgi:integrase
MVAMRKLGTIAKGNNRDRRPTLEELDRLLKHFEQIRTHRPRSVPMAKIFAFAIFSTRRQEEITRITWADFDKEASRIWVRDMKNPGDKKGNHVLCELTLEAVRIIESMPRVADQIFPFTMDAISTGFTRACQLLEIKDLHFHDLRHEGISRLFEMGRTIPQVAAVSGHKELEQSAALYSFAPNRRQVRRMVLVVGREVLPFGCRRAVAARDSDRRPLRSERWGFCRNAARNQRFSRSFSADYHTTLARLTRLPITTAPSTSTPWI